MSLRRPVVREFRFQNVRFLYVWSPVQVLTGSTERSGSQHTLPKMYIEAQQHLYNILNNSIYILPFDVSRYFYYKCSKSVTKKSQFCSFQENAAQTHEFTLVRSTSQNMVYFFFFTSKTRYVIPLSQKKNI